MYEIDSKNYFFITGNDKHAKHPLYLSLPKKL